MLLTIIPDWNSIDSVRVAHSRFELGGIVFFALLAIAETFAHNENDEKREHRFNTFGVWFFAIAVACEIAGYVYGQRNDSLSEGKITSLDALAHDADSTANDAKKIADGAKAGADAASAEVDAVGIRMGDLRKAVDFGSPRRRLLLAAAPKLIKALKPFAGQRVSLFVCGETPHGDHETMDTWAALANILAGDTATGLNQPHFFGASWNEVPSNLSNALTGCGGEGVSVSVSKEAPPQTREAAKVLADAIFGTLPPSIYNHFGESDPKFTRILLSRGFLDATSPAAALARDPTLIAVEIDAHPVQ